jgi:hypothetical protein
MYDQLGIKYLRSKKFVLSGVQTRITSLYVRVIIGSKISEYDAQSYLKTAVPT